MTATNEGAEAPSVPLLPEKASTSMTASSSNSAPTPAATTSLQTLDLLNNCNLLSTSLIGLTTQPREEKRSHTHDLFGGRSTREDRDDLEESDHSLVAHVYDVIVEVNPESGRRSRKERFLVGGGVCMEERAAPTDCSDEVMDGWVG